MITLPLPFPHLLSPSIRKQVTFYSVSGRFCRLASQAYSLGKPLCFEEFTLVFPSLTDGEVDSVESVFSHQTRDFRVVWTPPTEEEGREFRPPVKWKKTRTRLVAPRGEGCAGNPTGLAFLPSSLPSSDLAYRTRLEFTLSGDYILPDPTPEIHWDSPLPASWDSLYSWDTY